MFASVNLFSVRPGSMPEFLALNAEQFVPLLRQQVGVAAFEIVRTGDHEGVAIIWWESEQARDAATPMLAAWVASNLDPYFVTLTNPAGPVALSWRMP